MTPRIVPFTDTHAAPAAALTNRFINHTHIHFAEREQTADDWLDILTHQPPHHPLLAAEVQTDTGPRFAGYARAYTWRSRDAYRHTAETAVYIHQDFQRKGIATALYTALLTELKNRGGHTAVAGVALPNHASIRLHESLGFTHTGTFKQVGRKFDRWIDVAFYQRML